MIHFEVLGIPVAKGRPKFFRAGNFVRTYTPAKTERAENDIKLQALKHRPEQPLEGPLQLHIWFWLPVPSSWSRKQRELALSGARKPDKKPDIDNLAKLAIDAMIGIFFRDDSQICVLNACKKYSTNARTSVILEKL